MNWAPGTRDESRPQRRRRRSGQSFEEATARILAGLREGAEVHRNVKIRGVLSEWGREVDIQLVQPGQYEYIAFECKDHARPVDVPKIEAFATKLQDIRPSNGAVVSNSGYTQSALNMAKALGIDALALVDTDDPEINTRIVVTVLVRDLYVAGMRIALPAEEEIPSSADHISLVDANGVKSVLSRVVGAAWNSQRIPHERGDYVVPLAQWGFADWRTAQGAGPISQLHLVVRVDERCRLGELAILQSEGLYEVATGNYETRSLLTEQLDVTELSRWAHVTSGEADDLQYRGGVTSTITVSTPAIERQSS